MKYYFDASNQQVFAYETEEIARKFNANFYDLSEISENQINEVLQISDSKDHMNEIVTFNKMHVDNEILRATDALIHLNDAVELGMATNEEKEQRTALMKYRVLLKRVSMQSEWPLNPVWPECPEFFKPKE
ncbi:hypothetical protein B9T11_08675 [Wohlfahrtiimonas chitiniclastica]|uniref:tail fiber assembly protein n=1 Tax=Wohlfahrtiimonas chitiniclastica TaxID=400946 RepID=UPI000B99BD15|nr:tail fiber assembly protein [Wohlfahrtiimonas chitiniclastica]OYQ79299.1 hypothetical protein B9T11_08675 [Wohlfahrtiimonas chitiniclastica]